MLRFETISPREIDRYIYHERALIIDVRGEREYEKAHIENAVNIPFEKLAKDYGKMPRDFILILYCERGGTSLLAAKELFERGYVVKALIGGFAGYRGTHIVSE